MQKNYGDWEGAITETTKMAKLVRFLCSDDAEMLNGGKNRNQSTTCPLRRPRFVNAGLTSFSSNGDCRWWNYGHIKKEREKDSVCMKVRACVASRQAMESNTGVVSDCRVACWSIREACSCSIPVNHAYAEIRRECLKACLFHSSCRAGASLRRFLSATELRVQQRNEDVRS